MITPNGQPETLDRVPTVAPPGGGRYGGVTYREGERVAQVHQVDRYRRTLEGAKRPRDPGTQSPYVPANVGRHVVPHVMTFRGIITSLAKAYKIADAALLDSRKNSEMMRLDDSVMGPMFARQQAVALLNWHIEPEDDSDPKLKAVAREVTDLINRIENFTEYKRQLLEATWYGRYAVSNRWDVRYDRHGKRRYYIRQGRPIHGDKIAFRFDDGSGTYDPDQIGIRVSPAWARKDDLAGDRQIEMTQNGPAVFLEPWERSLVTLHKHMACDASFEDPILGSSIHGTGIRHFIYWTWYAKQECFAQLTELVETTAQGITVFRYPEGNEDARQRVEAVAKQKGHTNVLLMPSTENSDDYAIEVIPTTTAGLDQLHALISDYFNDQITRFICGQTLSRKSDATGLGSGVADLHEDSMFQMYQYDAIGLEETLTREVVRRLVEFNFPGYRQHDFWFRISTRSADNEGKLSAIRQAFDMGAQIRTADVMDIIGLAMPKGGEDFLSADQLQQASDSGAFPGLQMGFDAANQGSGIDPNEGGGMPPRIGGGAPAAAPAAQMGTADVAKLFGKTLYQRPRSDVDRRVAEAAAQCVENPSDAQREAGNYRKPKVTIQGLTVAIECAKGTRRRPQWPPMGAHYGYISRTEGADGDHVDCFIGPACESETVYVIDQVDQRGRFDEHKALIGFSTQREAIEAYRASYQRGWKVGPVTTLTMDQFRTWLDRYDNNRPIRHSPIAQYARQMGLFGEDFEPKKDPEKKPKKEKEKQGKLFSTEGLPGQQDFMGETDSSQDLSDDGQIGENGHARRKVQVDGVWGEYGANGEFYPAGEFINTIAENDKKAAKKRNRGSGKREIEPFVWKESPDPDARSIHSVFGGDFIRVVDGRAEPIDNQQAMSHYGYTPELLQAIAGAWNNGARWIKHDDGEWDASTTWDADGKTLADGAVVKDPSDLKELSISELDHAIKNTPPIPSKKWEEDWGSNRGQGKRSGYMVKGAMADPPRGKKTYTSILGNIDIPEGERDWMGSLDQHVQMAYNKARAYGLDHDHALSYAFGVDDGVGAEYLHDHIHNGLPTPKPEPEAKPENPLDRFTVNAERLDEDNRSVQANVFRWMAGDDSLENQAEAVSVGELRDRLGSLRDSLTSWKSRHKDDNHDAEMRRVMFSTANLLLATSKRASERDIANRDSLLAEARNAMDSFFTIDKVASYSRQGSLWNEEDHPRNAAGKSDGGQFTSSNSGGGFTAQPQLTDEQLRAMGIDPAAGSEDEGPDWSLHGEMADEARDAGRRKQPRIQQPKASDFGLKASDFGLSLDGVDQLGLDDNEYVDDDVQLDDDIDDILGPQKTEDTTEPQPQPEPEPKEKKRSPMFEGARKSIAEKLAATPEGKMWNGFKSLGDGRFERRATGEIVHADVLAESVAEHITTGPTSELKPDPKNGYEEVRQISNPVPTTSKKPRQRDTRPIPSPLPRQEPPAPREMSDDSRQIAALEDAPEGTEYAGAIKNRMGYWEHGADGRLLTTGQLLRRARREGVGQFDPAQPPETMQEAADVASLFGVETATPRAVMRAAASAGLPASTPEEAADSLRRAAQYADEVVRAAEAAGYERTGADPYTESMQAAAFVQQKSGKAATNNPRDDLQASLMELANSADGAAVAKLLSSISLPHVIAFAVAFWMARASFK